MAGEPEGNPMSTLTFNTLTVSRELTESGLTKQQAEAVTKAIKTAQDSHPAELPTKSDLKTEITRVEAKLDTEFAKVRGELKLVKWMLLLVIAVEVLPLPQAVARLRIACRSGPCLRIAPMGRSYAKPCRVHIGNQNKQFQQRHEPSNPNRSGSRRLPEASGAFGLAQGRPEP